ncbi:TetR/AcrR family transcriptional regulator [Streptomyces sp. NPDC005423]|uniref:TetR/AcrR family transcriptional regulator n=1 Tax=Streptomyces sp. NPDC005423 TaxID=3155343 RepID=UPI0033A6E67B
MYRATLDALAAHGPRRAGVTHIARLADTNRPFIYRNWPTPYVLLRDSTLRELRRVLDLAREVPGPPSAPECLSQAVHACLGLPLACPDCTPPFSPDAGPDGP